MANKVILKASDGTTVEFYDEIKAQGGVKDVYFSIDKTYVVAFDRKERLKRQKIAKSSICFEFQVVVAVVGFKWHRRGNAKNAD